MNRKQAEGLDVRDIWAMDGMSTRGATIEY